MQRPIPILPQPPALNPLKDAAKVEAIDYTADFENLFTCLDSIEKFIHTGRSKNDLIRYIHRLVFSRFFYICGNLGNVKKNRLEKFVSPVKWSAWLYTSTLQHFARHFFDVNGVFIVMRERCWNGGEYLKSFKNEGFSVK